MAKEVPISDTEEVVLKEAWGELRRSFRPDGKRRHIPPKLHEHHRRKVRRKTHLQ